MRLFEINYRAPKLFVGMWAFGVARRNVLYINCVRIFVYVVWFYIVD